MDDMTVVPLGEEKDAAEFVVTFRAVKGVEGLRALRALLKAAIRLYGLKCIKIVEGQTSRRQI
jgi:hypothetical protein